MCEATRAVFKRKLWLSSGFRFLIPCKGAGIAVPFLPKHQYGQPQKPHAIRAFLSFFLHDTS
jgi:hypothetical protein